VLNSLKDLPKVNILKTLDKHLIKGFDLIVLNPAVSIYNEHIKLAQLLNVKVISELELGYLFSNKKNIIAVTGTNGKTTTVKLLSDILRKKTKRVYFRVYCPNER
jgi:UDP-N-acetylmuramoylalanine--D-glutamate ligase